jgi:hypothetical protein
MITVLDMEGLSMFGGDSRFYKAIGKSSEMSALYYPQVVAETRHFSGDLMNLIAAASVKGV